MRELPLAFDLSPSNVVAAERAPRFRNCCGSPRIRTELRVTIRGLEQRVAGAVLARGIVTPEDREAAMEHYALRTYSPTRTSLAAN